MTLAEFNSKYADRSDAQAVLDKHLVDKPLSMAIKYADRELVKRPEKKAKKTRVVPPPKAPKVPAVPENPIHEVEVGADNPIITGGELGVVASSAVEAGTPSLPSIKRAPIDFDWVFSMLSREMKDVDAALAPGPSSYSAWLYYHKNPVAARAFVAQHVKQVMEDQKKRAERRNEVGAADLESHIARIYEAVRNAAVPSLAECYQDPEIQPASASSAVGGV